MTDEELIAVIRSAPWSDGFPYLRLTADRIEALKAEVEKQIGYKKDYKAAYEEACTQMHEAKERCAAAEAAAYEAAAKLVDAAHVSHITAKGRNPDHYISTYSLLSEEIRALATPDQTAALDRMRAEAKVEGILTAARITRVEAERLPISLHDAALKCEAAILRAIETLRVNGSEA